LRGVFLNNIALYALNETFPPKIFGLATPLFPWVFYKVINAGLYTFFCRFGLILSVTKTETVLFATSRFRISQKLQNQFMFFSDTDAVAVGQLLSGVGSGSGSEKNGAQNHMKTFFCGGYPKYGLYENIFVQKVAQIFF